MSNVGQGILAVAGGIAGFYVGGFAGAAYGFQLGLAVGTIVSPTQLPGTYGPRLTDNRTTTSQLGAPIVEVFGTDAVAGTVIWLGDIVEHSTTTEVGGKGGPEGSQTTFSYTQPIAIGLARGPMGGLVRIWENGKLVYDRREQQDGESDLHLANRITATDAYELTFTMYLGDEDQLPDPTIEAKEGIGNVPGYRGLMYIVYHDRELKDDQARRHPNFKFEIFDAGSFSCIETTQYSNNVLFPWLGTGVDPRNSLNDHLYSILGGGVPDPPAESDDLEEHLAYFESFKGIAYDELLGNATTNSEDGAGNTPNTLGGESAAGSNGPLVLLHYGRTAPSVYQQEGEPGGCATVEFSSPGTIIYSSVLGLVEILDIPGTTDSPIPNPPLSGWDYASRCVFVGGYWYQYSDDLIIKVRRVPAAPKDPCLSRPGIVGLPGYCLDASGLIVSAGEWTREDINYHVLQSYIPDFDPPAGNGSTLPLNPARPQGHADDNESFWTAAYESARDAGLMDVGLTYPSDYPELQGFGYMRVGDQCTVNTDGKSIADIVRTICARCGLTDIDVSDLQDRYVGGYQISRVMDGRSAIAPLRQVGFFDACESGGIVKFPTRGKATVRTLELEDLGAHAYDSEAPPSVTTRKQQDVELPRQLFVQYRDPARDYETGEQASPTRLITDAVNDSYVDVAVAIDATQAARCAEVIWADMWAQRWQHAISVDCSQAELEPTDCIIVPVDGRLERMRIVSGDDSAVILRQFSLVRDDDGSYVSVAISDPPAITPSTIIIYSPTTLLLLDLPALRVADNDAGIYAAARRTSTGLTWSGAQIYRSTDAGSTFPAVASVVNESTTGTLDVAFAAGDTTVWDDITEVFVTLISGTLESRTDDDVLAGANSIAIGAHGRWEILQFGTAEQIDTDQWKLTHLLRGRRGTEHNMATQIAGDTWVLISGAGIIRLPLTNSQIGTDIIYKAVTFGASFATGTDITFASDGEALVPFSPVSIDGERDSSGDLVISWIRRDRLGEELPDGSVIAMSDPPESYEIDIVTDDSSATVVRTLTSSTQTVTYTSAQEADDFGSSLPDSIIVRVYQMSAVVGRGTAGEVTIEDMS